MFSNCLNHWCTEDLLNHGNYLGKGNSNLYKILQNCLKAVGTGTPVDLDI